MRKSREADKGAKERVQGCLPVNWRRKNWATEREREKERVCSAYTVLLFICRCFYPSEVRVVSDCLPVCLSVCLSLVFAASDEDQ